MAQQNKGKGRSRRSGSGSTKGQNTLQHPGAVLAQILEDTPTRSPLNGSVSVKRNFWPCSKAARR